MISRGPPVAACPMKMNMLEERPVEASAAVIARDHSFWSDADREEMSIGLPTAYTPATTSRTSRPSYADTRSTRWTMWTHGDCARKWCAKVNSSVRGA